LLLRFLQAQQEVLAFGRRAFVLCPQKADEPGGPGDFLDEVGRVRRDLWLPSATAAGDGMRDGSSSGKPTLETPTSVMDAVPLPRPYPNGAGSIDNCSIDISRFIVMPTRSSIRNGCRSTN
jgi:hypothetical protein